MSEGGAKCVKKRLSLYRMSEGTTIRFIEMYRSEECLWNSQHPDYRNKDARMKAAEKISERINIAAFGPREVTKRFTKIRSSYCLELRKIGNSLKRGDTYKPKMPWFYAMDSFMKSMVHPKEMKLINQDNDHCEMIEINNEEFVKVMPGFQFDNGESEHNELRDDDIISDYEDFNSASNDPNKTEAEDTTKSSPIEEKKSMDNPEYVTTLKMHENKYYDKYDEFARFIATQLRELPIEHAAKAEVKILQCLADIRIHYFEEHASRTYYS